MWVVRVSFEDFSNNNDFADVTLAYEVWQQGEAHKVILAGQVLTVIITYHQHQQLARGCRSSDAQLPHFPPAQIPVGVDGLASLAWDWTNLFLSGCWAAGIEGRKLMNFNQVAFSFKTQGTNEPSPPASISNICPGTWNLALPLVMLSLRVCIIWV